MRVEAWNPNVMDETFENVAIERLIEAAELVAAKARSNRPPGTISRPMYRSGPYANQPWTARDAGSLQRSIRVVIKRTKTGKPLSRKRDVRVYAGPRTGHKEDIPYYASIVEYSRPYLRPALLASIPAIRSIVGAK